MSAVRSRLPANPTRKSHSGIPVLIVVVVVVQLLSLV